MRFNSILLLAPFLALALANPDEDSAHVRDIVMERMSAVEQRDVLPIEGRASCKKVGCKCQKVPQGQYCGLCIRNGDFTVLELGSGNWNDVFECNKNGGCCSYGYAKDCNAGGSGMRCG